MALFKLIGILILEQTRAFAVKTIDSASVQKLQQLEIQAQKSLNIKREILFGQQVVD